MIFRFLFVHMYMIGDYVIECLQFGVYDNINFCVLWLFAIPKKYLFTKFRVQYHHIIISIIVCMYVYNGKLLLSIFNESAQVFMAFFGGVHTFIYLTFDPPNRKKKHFVKLQFVQCEEFMTWSMYIIFCSILFERIPIMILNL